MSTLATNAITDAAGGNTATINSYTPTESNMAGRNLIINGAMQVAQRGTSFTGVTSSAYYLDRFRLVTDTSPGTFTVSQASDAPDGFGSSFKVETTTANASADADDLLFVDTALEGQNLQALKKGTASAESMTLSFWVKSSLTGTYTAEFRDYDNSRHIAQNYTVDSANTWEYKTLTFSGDTVSGFDNDNAKSLSIQFWLHSGSRWNGGTLATSWATYADANRASSSQINLGDTLNATFYITGVQLEAGSVATPFEHRPYGQELALCQRYAYPIRGGFSGFGNGTTVVDTGFNFPVEMRSAPSVTQGTLVYIAYGAGSSFIQSASSNSLPNSITQNGCILRFNNFTGLTANSAYVLAPNATTSAVTTYACILTAEL